MFSSFRGLGMKPISQPSFTKRPIHQSLLNFWKHQNTEKRPLNLSQTYSVSVATRCCSNETMKVYLLYVEEVLGVERDGCGRDRNVLIQSTTVADIGPHSERYGFALWDGNQVWWEIKCFRTQMWLSFSMSGHRLATLALSSWMAACCSLSWRLCPGPWLWLGLWLWTWACTSRSSSRDTSESDGLLV